MGLIERYVFRRLTGAFLTTLVALAGVVWMTQALRQLNLVTAKGQTLLTFLEISVLALPFLTQVIAPFAFLTAAIVTLNALNADSEMVVINASGASRLTVLRPILLLAALIAASMAVAGTALAPIAQRQLRTEITKVNVDLIANIVRPGLFSEIEPGLTFHIRNRAGDGSLAGLVIDDQRDPAIAYTYIAEQAVVLEVPGRTLLVMRDGALQRLQRAEDALSIVKFEAYAFDLSDLTPQNSAPVYKPSERSTAELLAPDLTDDYTQKNIARFRSELHDRLSQPLLPLAFAVVAFLFLGDARTTRQGRGFAVAAAILGAAAVRGLHFVAVSRSGTAPGLAWLAYAIPAGTLAFGVGMVMLDRQFALPRPVERVFDAVSEGLQGLWERLGVLRRGRAG